MSLKIVPNSERVKYVTTANNALLEQRIPPADPIEPFERHIWNSILIWTNVNDSSSALASKTTINLPVVHRVRPETLQKWQTQLESAGYIVTKDEKIFNVSIEQN